jgi:arylsulfatase A-like enzyme
MGGWQGAVCIASRSMIISGRSLWNAKEISDKWKKKENFELAEQSWGKLMEKKGYKTYMSGKWHVSIDPQKVFQTVRNIKPGMPRDFFKKEFKKGYNRPINERDKSWIPYDSLNGGFWEGGKHWSEVLKDDALDFIDDASNSDDPFFMYLAFNAPHDPRQSPKSFLDQYPFENISLPENWLPEYPNKEAIGNPKTLRDEALAPFPRTPYAIKTHIREYYAIITHLDQQIGEILAALKKSGKDKNTYIFFTGDHGLSVGRHGLLGKQNMFDHSIRVPLLMVGPDIPKKYKIEQEVYLQDIMATSLELANIDQPDDIEFNSLLSSAMGTSQEKIYKNGIYGAYIDYQRMIRKDGFKLIVYPKIKKTVLFDLKNDPLEINDLSTNVSYLKKKTDLFTGLLSLQKKFGDPLDLSSLVP